MISKPKWSMVVCLLSALLVSSNASASKQSSVNKHVSTVEKTVRIAFAKTPVLIAIAKCESRFRHYDENGRPLRNEGGSSAVGVMQIMYSVHHKSARRLGLNINTIEGNLEYAKYLYRNEGTRPWNASKHCWRSN